MSWSRSQFISILETRVVQQLFSDPEIFSYVKDWSEDNKAALLHANNITAESDFSDSLLKLQLVAAFARKDLKRMEYLLFTEKVSTGVRLDYMLPLYNAHVGAGEDIFVASTKALLSGNVENDIHMPDGKMIHKVGPMTGSLYAREELDGIEGYVNNSHLIRQLLKSAPNQTVIQPNTDALDYMIRNAKTYRDTNNNPVIVFIPGAIAVDGYPVPDLIQAAVDNGADVNDIGFFGVPGIVWSIILADVDAVRKFIRLDAKLDIEDEMKSPHVNCWAESTRIAAADDAVFRYRLAVISRLLTEKKMTLQSNSAFFSGISFGREAQRVMSVPLKP